MHISPSTNACGRAVALWLVAAVAVPASLLWQRGPVGSAVVLEAPPADQWHTEQVVRGGGYGLVWGQVRDPDAYGEGLRERVMTQVAVWWDDTGAMHTVDGGQVARDGFTFHLVYVDGYDPATGDLRCLGACLEWLDWFDLNALLVDAEPWNGPRWVTVRVPAAAPAFPADFNRDGLVDTRDVAAFLNTWTPQSRGAGGDR